MTSDLIDAVLFYLKDKNTHKYYTIVIVFYLMFTKNN